MTETRRSLGQLLREARLRGGLSPAALADGLGVSRVTVREAELGRDPRHSTLQRYVDRAGLSPSVLLEAGAGRIPPASAGAWAWQARVLGHVVRRLRHHHLIDADGEMSTELEMRGVRSVSADLRDPRVRGHLLRSVVESTGPEPLQLDARPSDLKGKTRRVKDGTTLHELSFPRHLQRFGFTWKRTSVAVARGDRPAGVELLETALPEHCLERGGARPIQHPVELLELGVRLDRGRLPGPPRVHAWPMALVPSEEAASLARELHGEGGLAVETSERACSVRITRPIVGLCYGLTFRDPPSAGRDRIAVPRGEDGPGALAREDGGRERSAEPVRGAMLGTRLRRAREREGLSRRALAQRMGVSAMTVSGAESGRDCRHSTLESWLAALPRLSPHDVLELPEDPARLSREQAWAFLRDAAGVAAEQETKTVRISADGSAKLEIETHGLRALRDPGGDLRSRLGLRPARKSSRAFLQAVRADGTSAQLRISRVSGLDGLPQHQLTVPAELALQGVSFRRELVHPGVYQMTAERARQATGGEGPFDEGTTFGPLLPCERLRLVVRFPPEAWPLDVRARAWPLTAPPDTTAEDLAERLHPEGLRVREDRRRRRIELSVEQPLVGVKYALAWELP